MFNWASNRGLGLFALLTAVATLFLLCARGLVVCAAWPQWWPFPEQGISALARLGCPAGLSRSGNHLTGKSADIATAHVAVGALVLMTGVLLNVGIARVVVPVPGAVRGVEPGSFGSRHLDRIAPRAAPVGGANA